MITASASVIRNREYQDMTRLKILLAVVSAGFLMACSTTVDKQESDPFVMLRLRGTATFSEENWEKTMWENLAIVKQ